MPSVLVNQINWHFCMWYLFANEDSNLCLLILSYCFESINILDIAKILHITILNGSSSKG